MSKQDIIFTAIPNGLAGTDESRRLRFSVHVAPRLTSDPDSPNLSKFQDFWDWPAVVKRTSFMIQFEGVSTLLPAQKVSNPDSSIWKALFNKSTYVEPYEFDSYADLNILSYPARNILSFLQTAYVQVATSSPRRFPSLQDLAALIASEIGFWKPGGPKGEAPKHWAGPEDKVVNRIDDYLHATRTKYRRGAVQTQTSDYQRDPCHVQMDFEQLKLFHRPRNLIRVQEDQIKKVQRIDFHQMITNLEQYPGVRYYHASKAYPDQEGLMRRLGLVIDLELKLAPDQKIPPSGSLWLILKALDGSSFRDKVLRSVINPRTQYSLSSTDFRAATRPTSDLGNGMLQINVSTDPQVNKFDIIQVDQDGAAIKLMDFANNLIRLQYGAKTVDTPTTASLPSLRSGGISLTRADLAFQLVQACVNAVKINAAAFPSAGAVGTVGPSNNATVFLDDLVRGYRFDVWDAQTKRWNSLCGRVGTYELLNSKSLTITDEGWVSMGVTKAPPTDKTSPPPDPDLYLHESLFRWTGWSLTAPRPGQSITNEGVPRKYLAHDAVEYSNEQWAAANPPINWQLATSFQAPAGSLPRLRFGNSYRIRARAVDLAGNSLSPDDPTIPDVGSPSVSGEVLYSRYEPVSAPTIVLSRKLNPNLSVANLTNIQDSPSESLQRLVIRSNFPDVSAVDYNNALNALKSEQGKHYLQDSFRYIAPPRTSEMMAETHGMFDDPTTHKFNPEKVLTYEKIASADKWVFPVWDTEEVSNLTYQVSRDRPNYPIWESDVVDVQYLPDPISRGAALLFVSEETPGFYGPIPLKSLIGVDNPIMVPFYPQGAAWPGLKLFGLRLTEYKGAPPNWSIIQATAGGILEVQLPKGAVVDVLVSSYMRSEDIPLMGILNWVKQLSKDPDDFQNLRNLALQGGFWMVTPFRKVTLVHAVQQPSAPVLELNDPEKQVGWTYVTLEGLVTLDSTGNADVGLGNSTSKLDILAAWEDPIDDGQNPPSTATVTESSYTLNNPAVRRSHVFELTSIPPRSQQISFNHQNEQSPPVQGWHPPDAQIQEFGDTKYHHVSYTAVATTRFLEYFPDSVWKNSNNDENGMPSKITSYANATPNDTMVKYKKWLVAKDILSSARPAKPKVEYVLPTFSWDRGDTESDTEHPQLRSFRKGGGLRVYMDRPWWSSGAKELLGVIVWPKPDVVPPDSVKPYVTQWGMDPLSSTNPISPPSVNSFSNPSRLPNASNTNLKTVEMGEDPQMLVSVVGHDVGFDESRGLWYSDIQVDSGATYCPFIRLALARYNPMSLSGLELSPIVLADFAQLAPDRSIAILTPDSSHPEKREVTVVGLFPRSKYYVDGTIGYTASIGTKVAVFVQRKIHGAALSSVPDEHVAWEVVQGPIWLSPTAYQGNPNYNLQWRTAPGNPITLNDLQSGQALRLIIAEYETFPGNEVTGQTPLTNDLTVSVAGGDLIIAPEPGLRLVFSETFQVTQHSTTIIGVSQAAKNT